MALTIPYFVHLAAGDGEETFWIQLLVIVILAAGVGIFGVVKKHKTRYGSTWKFLRQALDGLIRRGRDLAIRQARRMSELRQALIPAIHRTKTKLGRIFKPDTSLLKIEAAKSKKSVTELSVSKPGRPAKRDRRDFDSGMELLTRDFLVEVVERTGPAEMRDITMRTLCFVELVRRGELWAVASDALKTYTLNAEGAFNKSIRYQAMRELAKRTTEGTQPTNDEAAAGKTA